MKQMLTENDKIEIAVYHTRVKYDNSVPEVMDKFRLVEKWIKRNFLEDSDEVHRFINNTLVKTEARVFSINDGI